MSSCLIVPIAFFCCALSVPVILVILAWLNSKHYERVSLPLCVHLLVQARGCVASLNVNPHSSIYLVDIAGNALLVSLAKQKRVVRDRRVVRDHYKWKAALIFVITKHTAVLSDYDCNGITPIHYIGSAHGFEANLIFL